MAGEHISLFSASAILTEMRDDIKKLISTSAQNEERFKNGNLHFGKIDEILEKLTVAMSNLDKRVVCIEAKKCPPTLSLKAAASLIIVGFAVLAFLTSQNKPIKTVSVTRNPVAVEANK